MSEKVYIVTGASSGIGVGIAECLTKSGAKKLVLVARRQEKLKDVAKSCKKLGAKDVLVLPKDLSDLTTCPEIVKETIDKFGRLDVLINNAGVSDFSHPVSAAPDDYAQKTFNINFFAPLALTRESLPHIRKNKGNIIFISSIVAHHPVPGGSIYNASKAALTSLAKTTALEEAPRGVRVNIISPGPIMSEMTKGLLGGKIAGLKKSEWFLALRALISKPAEFYCQEKIGEMLERHDTRYGLNSSEEDPYLTNDHRSLFNLVTIRELWTTETHLFKAFVVCFLLRCLQKKTNYFDGTVEGDILKIGKMLVHLMEICTVNAHEVGVLKRNNNTTDENKSKSNQRQLSRGCGTLLAAGTSLEPTLVLANHACEDPTMLRVNVGGCGTWAFAARDIKEGEEITDSYLPLGQSMSVEYRRADLEKRYHFTCQCKPCMENWPPANEMPRGLHDVDPSQFKFPLEDIRKMQAQFAKIQKLGATINEASKKSDQKSCLSLAIEFLRCLEETLNRPHQFYIMAARTLATALWCIHGSKCVNWSPDNQG